MIKIAKDGGVWGTWLLGVIIPPLPNSNQEGKFRGLLRTARYPPPRARFRLPGETTIYKSRSSPSLNYLAFPEETSSFVKKGLLERFIRPSNLRRILVNTDSHNLSQSDFRLSRHSVQLLEYNVRYLDSCWQALIFMGSDEKYMKISSFCEEVEQLFIYEKKRLKIYPRCISIHPSPFMKYLNPQVRPAPNLSLSSSSYLEFRRMVLVNLSASDIISREMEK